MDKLNILILDDDFFCCNFLQGHLNNLGHNSQIALNKKEAVDIVSNSDYFFDVYIIDFLFPSEKDSKEAADLLLALHKAPIILMSAELDETTSKMIFESGIDFITPLEKKNLDSFEDWLEHVYTEKKI